METLGTKKTTDCLHMPSAEILDRTDSLIWASFRFIS